MDEFISFSDNKRRRVKFYVFSRRRHHEELYGEGNMEEGGLSSLL